MNASKVRKAIRLQLGMSQEAFAAAIHVAFSTVNRWGNYKSTPNSMARALIADFCEKHGINEELIATLRDRGR